MISFAAAQRKKRSSCPQPNDTDSRTFINHLGPYAKKSGKLAVVRGAMVSLLDPEPDNGRLPRRLDLGLSLSFNKLSWNQGKSKNYAKLNNYEDSVVSSHTEKLDSK